ncbi:DNA alkylation response protein [Verticiella sediminum]|uniref:DNA alkylation response protein n=1 Tax=Verticiella sediminum TaxID=1247510 RepID=A0A556AJN8_9BURK|nr:acyl-CoA dehydrogenase family protein [Verticiella sediminum]TSH93089.1 DNA alkylation response protein [Verticiella sediminum]
MDKHATHEVINQVDDLPPYDLYTTDAGLTDALGRVGADRLAGRLSAYGAALGLPQARAWAEDAERYPPELQTHDRAGHRIDQVRFHPAWHRLMGMLREAGFVTLPYSEPGPGAWPAYAAAMYLHGQVDAGSLCPSTMTMASIDVLRDEPALFERLRDRLYAREYDERDVPIEDKRSITIGMGMTEKQGGSDLRANTTRAVPVSGVGRGARYAITGHKWFFSAPMCDAHLVLARTDAGPSCFFVPRWRADGTRNAIAIQRLKDKLGNRSNSSSEVEFHDAEGIMAGDEGRGIATIMRMATFSRLSCVMGSAALMRQALVQALHYARHRWAFGRELAEQPLMRSVLADLALESEAATALMVRLAHAFAHADDEEQQGWCRIVMPAAKFWICKRAVTQTGEAMEVLGGNGYVESRPLARLYREAPVNSIWEGSGNVICLDVLRAVARQPDVARRLLGQFAELVAVHPVVADALRRLERAFALPEDAMQAAARGITQDIALLAQASVMQACAPAPVAEAFVRSRFHAESGRVFGVLPQGLDAGPILARALPLL